MQAAGSWSLDACCAVPNNECQRGLGLCEDRASSSDWLFGLWPGPPQRFEPTGTDNRYQFVHAVRWPQWGGVGIGGTRRGTDLAIGGGAPGGRGSATGACNQGNSYRGTDGEICGGDDNWGATDVEVWYPI